MNLPVPRTPDPAEAPPLRWGILAPGGIAATFVDALRKHTRQEVVAVGSRSGKRAAAFAARFDIARSYDDYEQLVADPGVDAIYVASPHSHHAEQSLLAISAGKHVLVEKAFTPSTEQAQQVVDAAATAGVTLMEAMWTRFLPHIDIVRQLLEDGALGEVETVIADHGQWFPNDPTHRLHDPALAGGAMWDLGVYPVSFAAFVLGLPGRVTAVGSRTPLGVDRQASVVLDGFQPQQHANAVINTTLAAVTPTTASVSGSEGFVDVPGAFYSPQRVRFVPRHQEPVLSDEPVIQGHEGLAFEAAHFAQLVADDRRESPLLPWAETVGIVSVMEQALAQI